jgi:hypothetical protein
MAVDVHEPALAGRRHPRLDVKHASVGAAQPQQAGPERLDLDRLFSRLSHRIEGTARL